MLPMPAPSRQTGVSDGPLYFLSARRIPRLRAWVTFGRSGPLHRLSLCLRRPHFLQQRKGDAPRPRARVTFGRSPKSDQKRCLKPQVSRLPARLGCAENRRRVPRENQNSADIVVQRIACGPLIAAAPTYHAEVHCSTAVGYGIFLRYVEAAAGIGAGGDSLRGPFCGVAVIGRKEFQKPLVFGGVLSPISFAAGRNGAAGGIEREKLAGRCGQK